MKYSLDQKKVGSVGLHRTKCLTSCSKSSWTWWPFTDIFSFLTILSHTLSSGADFSWEAVIDFSSGYFLAASVFGFVLWLGKLFSFFWIRNLIFSGTVVCLQGESKSAFLVPLLTCFLYRKESCWHITLSLFYPITDLQFSCWYLE